MNSHPGPTLVAVAASTAIPLRLPGRDWSLLLGPENVGSRNITMGFAVFPGGSAPTGHMHSEEEEMVFVLSGRGRITSDGVSLPLEPGVAVYIPPGVRHSTSAYPGQALRLVTVFSPPVVPGSYEPTD